MEEELRANNGSVRDLVRVPDDLKVLYRTAFELDQIQLLKANAARGVHIDQGQSHNIYAAEADGKKLNVIYTTAWKLGLKTTYYLRSQAKANAESSNSKTIGANNAVALSPAVVEEPQPKMCLLDDPDCEACQ
jgi:ribonucleoside-diphosphate reductase alpha chain